MDLTAPRVHRHIKLRPHIECLFLPRAHLLFFLPRSPAASSSRAAPTTSTSLPLSPSTTTNPKLNPMLQIWGERLRLRLDPLPRLRRRAAAFVTALDAATLTSTLCFGSSVSAAASAATSHRRPALRRRLDHYHRRSDHPS